MYPAGGRKVFYLRKEHNTMGILNHIFTEIGQILEWASASDASKKVMEILAEIFNPVAPY